MNEHKLLCEFNPEAAKGGRRISNESRTKWTTSPIYNGALFQQILASFSGKNGFGGNSASDLGDRGGNHVVGTMRAKVPRATPLAFVVLKI